MVLLPLLLVTEARWFKPDDSSPLTFSVAPDIAQHDPFLLFATQSVTYLSPLRRVDIKLTLLCGALPSSAVSFSFTFCLDYLTCSLIILEKLLSYRFDRNVASTKDF